MIGGPTLKGHHREGTRCGSSATRGEGGLLRKEEALRRRPQSKGVFSGARGQFRGGFLRRILCPLGNNYPPIPEGHWGKRIHEGPWGGEVFCRLLHSKSRNSAIHLSKAQIVAHLGDRKTGGVRSRVKKLYSPFSIFTMGLSSNKQPIWAIDRLANRL